MSLIIQPTVQFSVATFNILDAFLAKRTLPRQILPEFTTKLTEVTLGNFKYQNLSRYLYEEYDTNFHKVFCNDDKYFKRETLWDSDINTKEAFEKLKGKNTETFKHLTYLSPNTYSSTYKNDKKCDPFTFKSLKGALLDGYTINLELTKPSDDTNQHNQEATRLSNMMYNELMKSDDLDWSRRGEHVASKIEAIDADIIMLQESGQQYNLKMSDGGQTMTEYLNEKGYHSVYFFHPKFNIAKVQFGDNVEGISIYYKSSVFVIDTRENKESKNDIDNFIVDINNFKNMNEDSNNTHPTLLQCIDTDADNNLKGMTGELINHKLAGVIKLRHIATNMNIVVVNTHMVTDSRDKDGKHKQKELLSIKNTIERLQTEKKYDPENDGLIFGGDLNTRLFSTEGIYNDRDIFGNKFLGNIIINKDIMLSDSYLNMTTKSLDVNSTEHYTSINSQNNKNIIDYIFYSQNITKKNTQIITPSDTDPLPSVDNPSDHLPVKCVFEIKYKEQPQSGGFNNIYKNKYRIDKLMYYRL